MSQALSTNAIAERRGTSTPTPPSVPRAFYSIKQVCELLGICEATFFNIVASGKLTVTKIANRKTIVADRHLAEYLASCEYRRAA